MGKDFFSFGKKPSICIARLSKAENSYLKGATNHYSLVCPEDEVVIARAITMIYTMLSLLPGHERSCLGLAKNPRRRVPF